MEGRRRVQAVDADDVHAGEHLIEAFPIGRLELGLQRFGHPAPVVVVDGDPEAARPPRDRAADPAHAEDAEPLARDAMTEHRRRAPARPFPGAGETLAFDQPPGYRQDQGHGHVCGVFGQHARVLVTVIPRA